MSFAVVLIYTQAYESLSYLQPRKMKLLLSTTCISEDENSNAHQQLCYHSYVNRIYKMVNNNTATNLTLSSCKC
jgi:hypothetical protein